MTKGLDGLSGAVLGIEGIVGSTAILHGPLGCKYFQGHLAEARTVWPGGMDANVPEELGFFGQARVPCDFLDVHDYIDGGSRKLEEVLPLIARRRKGLLTVINSPGAALIGDDLSQSVERLGLSDRVVIMDAPPFSRPASEGFEDALLAMLSAVRPSPISGDGYTVNLLGLSLAHKNWQGTIMELSKTLSLMGIEVACAVGAGSTIDELKSSARADFNIVMCPEYSSRTAEWYAREYNMPYISSPGGAPLGFDATESLIRTVSEEVGVDPSPALRYLESAKECARSALERFSRESGPPKGATFGIRADSSMAYPLTRWLVTYLGMWPEVVELLPGSDKGAKNALCSFLTNLGGDDAMIRRMRETAVDVAFASGDVTSTMLHMGACSVAIPLMLPDHGRFELVPRTYWGISGSLQILEDLLNGL